MAKKNITFRNFAPEAFIFTKDGKIVLRGYYRTEIGTWKLTHPRAEAKARGNRYASQLVESMWYATINTKNTKNHEVMDYSREALKKGIAEFIKVDGGITQEVYV